MTTSKHGRLAVDIGGTFTDVALDIDSRLTTTKVLTTHIAPDEAVMQGIALVPEPLWWILGAVISFYFGARHQVKGQEFQGQMSNSLARLPQVSRNIASIHALKSGAMVLSTRGTALNAGAVGDTIGILNDRSRRTIQAVVTGPGQAVVGSNDPVRLVSAQ